MSVSIDGSEVYALAARQRMAPVRLMADLVPVAHKAGNKLKSGLRAQASGHRGMGGLVGGISYEIEMRPDGVEVAAGWFAPTGQQHLENIAAFGTERAAPVMDITVPLAAEAGPFAKFVAQAAAKAMT